MRWANKKYFIAVKTTTIKHQFVCIQIKKNQYLLRFERTYKKTTQSNEPYKNLYVCVCVCKNAFNFIYEPSECFYFVFIKAKCIPSINRLVDSFTYAYCSNDLNFLDEWIYSNVYVCMFVYNRIEFEIYATAHFQDGMECNFCNSSHANCKWSGYKLDATHFVWLLKIMFVALRWFSWNV